MVSLKWEMFKMVTYLSIPNAMYYMLNSPVLNLFRQREIMKRHEIQRHKDVNKEEETTVMNENIKEFAKWKKQNQ